MCRLIVFLVLCGLCAAWILAQYPEAATLTAPSSLKSGLNPISNSSEEGKIEGSSQVATTALALEAVFPDINPILSYALISMRGGRVSRFRTGDPIKDGVRLFAVYHDHVLLDVKGEIRTLRLTNAGTADSSTPLIRSSSTFTSGFSDRPMDIKSPGPLRDALRYSEFRAAGALRAITVLPGKDPQMLEKLNLRPGDLIIAINGTSMNVYQNGAAALESLGELSESSITIVRNGRKKVLEFHHGPFQTISVK